MPLDPTGPDLSFFDDPPSSAEEAAEKWATSLGNYALTLTQVSLTVEVAKSALQASLTATFQTSTDAAATFDAALAAFAATVAGGMLPAFVGVPPATPFSEIVFPAEVLYPDSEAAKSAIGALIYAWFLTGQATPSAGGPAVPWS